MSTILTHLRLIDHQADPTRLYEVYAGPDGRRIRFTIDLTAPTAYSQVWSGVRWETVHTLHDAHFRSDITTLNVLNRLMPVTEDILGWSGR